MEINEQMEGARAISFGTWLLMKSFKTKDEVMALRAAIIIHVIENLNLDKFEEQSTAIGYHIAGMNIERTEEERQEMIDWITRHINKVLAIKHSIRPLKNHPIPTDITDIHKSIKDFVDTYNGDKPDGE